MDSPRVFRIPRKCTTSFTASLKAWSSATVVEVATHVCRLAAHDIAPTHAEAETSDASSIVLAAGIVWIRVSILAYIIALHESDANVSCAYEVA